MRISNRVYLVGSGRVGFQMSHSIDCNIYLLDAGTTYILVDAGGGVEPERIVENIEKEGISMNHVSHLLLTHVHADHAAGAHFFYENYGLEVICSAEAKPWLEQADIEKVSLSAAITAGVYPTGYQYPPCPVSQSVSDDESIQIGEIDIHVLATPGHSRGHVSFLIEEDGKRSLFAGDTIFAMGRVVMQNTWDCKVDEYAQTMDKLSKLSIDRLYPGHGPFLLAEADSHVELANDCFKRLEIPPNL